MSIKFDHVVLGVTDMEIAAEAFRSRKFDVYNRDEGSTDVMDKQFVRFADQTFIELIEFRGPSTHRFSTMTKLGAGWVDLALGADDLDAVGEALARSSTPFVPKKVMSGLAPDGKTWELDLLLAGLGIGSTALPFLINERTPKEWRLPTGECDAMISGIIGVTIVVNSLVSSLPGLEAIYGTGKPTGRTMVFDCAPGWVEVVEPVASSSPHARHLMQRGEGIYEIALGSKENHGLVDFGASVSARIRLVAPDAVFPG